MGSQEPSLGALILMRICQLNFKQEHKKAIMQVKIKMKQAMTNQNINQSPHVCSIRHQTYGAERDFQEIKS